MLVSYNLKFAKYTNQGGNRLGQDRLCLNKPDLFKNIKA